MKGNKYNHLNPKNLYEVRLAKERLRYKVLQDQITLKDELKEFREIVKDTFTGSFRQTGIRLFTKALLKIF